MQRFCKSLLFFMFFMLVSFISQAQNKPEQPIILEYADSLVGTRGQNMEIREFIGNVKLKQGDVTVQCDRAIQYLNLNKAELSGNVHINQQELDLFTPLGVYDGNLKIASSVSGLKITDRKTVLTAQEGTYSTSLQIANFRKNVRIEDDSVIILSDRLVYHRKNKNSFATGDVLIFGKYTNTYLLGDTVEHYPDGNITLVKGEPRLFQIDTVKNDTIVVDTTENRIEGQYARRDSTQFSISFDTLSVTSYYMKSINDKNSNKEIVYFIDSVEISQRRLGAKADTAIYNKTDGIITLSGHPLVFYDSTQLYADSIYIYVPDMKLKELLAVHNSIACTRNDTNDLRKINQIVGDEIRIKFVNDTINAILSFGNAKSLYFLASDSSGAGMHRSSSDSIVVDFDKGKIDRIIWLGGVNGDFRPENMLNEVKGFYLPGFKWSDIKPKKVVLKLKRKLIISEE